MSQSITIRNLPEETMNELAARAALTGRLRAQLIALARRPEPQVWLARVRQTKERSGTKLPPERILSHREADRP